jgi:hypothetical protein
LYTSRIAFSSLTKLLFVFLLALVWSHEAFKNETRHLIFLL